MPLLWAKINAKCSGTTVKTPEQKWCQKEGKNTSVADCMFGTPSWDHETDRWDVSRVKQVQDICLFSLCLVDSENQKFGSNLVLTREPINMLAGCTGSEKETAAWQTLDLGKKENLWEEIKYGSWSTRLAGETVSRIWELEDTTQPAGKSRLKFLLCSLLPQFPHQEQHCHTYKGFLFSYVPMQFLGPAEKGT